MPQVTLPETQEALLQRLEESIIHDLTQPRPIKDQVLIGIADNYGVGGDGLPDFFKDKLAGLEPYEWDVTFSPQFTPTLQDRKRYLGLIGPGHISKDALQQLIDRIVGKHLAMPLQHSGQQNTLSLPLNDVVVERYVLRLGLERPVPEALEQVLEHLSAQHADVYTTLNSLFREACLNKPERVALVKAVVATMLEKDQLQEDTLLFLIDTIRTYSPNSQEDLKRQLEALITSCKDDIAAAPDRSYHNEDLKFQHSGNAKDMAQADVIREHYQAMIGKAEALLGILS